MYHSKMELEIQATFHSSTENPTVKKVYIFHFFKSCYCKKIYTGTIDKVIFLAHVYQRFLI